MKFLKLLTDRIFFRNAHVCPWWLCFTFDNVFRKLFHNPEDILAPYIHSGSTVLDIGAGMGYFTIPIARLVGNTGIVIAADLQEEMLQSVNRRARKAKLEDRIITHLCTPVQIGINAMVDFCLAFWMMHEVPDKYHLLNEISSIMQKNGLLLLVEPRIHVTKNSFAETLNIAKSVSFQIIDQPEVLFSHSALLKRMEE